MPGPYRFIRLITRAWRNRLYRLPPKKDYHVYITRSIYHYAYARQTQVNCRKEIKKRKEDQGKERKEKKAKQTKKQDEKGKETKETKRKARKDKTRRGSKKGKRKKEKCHTSRPEELAKDGIGLIKVSRASSMALGRERSMAKKLAQSYAIL